MRNRDGPDLRGQFPVAAGEPAAFAVTIAAADKVYRMADQFFGRLNRRLTPAQAL